MISLTPRIDPGYLAGILNLPFGERIGHVEVTQAAPTDTALIIKATVFIHTGFVSTVSTHNGKKQHVRKLFIKTSKPSDSSNPYREKSLTLTHGKPVI